MATRARQMGLAVAGALELSLFGTGGRAAAAPSAPGADEMSVGQSVCGAPGVSPCLLQRWMRGR
jgi:hypothetical protein